MRARDLIVEARRLLNDGRGVGWAPSVVILTRKALEAGIDLLYGRRSHTCGLVAGSWRDKLVCLPHYFHQGPSPHPLAAKVAWCWSALSDASHHRGLHMTPSAQDLTAWLDTTDEFVTVLQA